MIRLPILLALTAATVLTPPLFAIMVRLLIDAARDAVCGVVDARRFVR